MKNTENYNHLSYTQRRYLSDFINVISGGNTVSDSGRMTAGILVEMTFDDIKVPVLEIREILKLGKYTDAQAEQLNKLKPVYINHIRDLV